jgi:hypothetical protein
VSRETVRSISELLREVREGGASADPAFFDRKAAVFDAIAADDPTDPLRCAVSAPSQGGHR